MNAPGLSDMPDVFCGSGPRFVCFVKDWYFTQPLVAAVATLLRCCRQVDVVIGFDRRRGGRVNQMLHVLRSCVTIVPKDGREGAWICARRRVLTVTERGARGGQNYVCVFVCVMR